MKTLPDNHGDARRAWLREFQGETPVQQSDFEKSLAFVLTMIVAVFVIAINLIPDHDAPVVGVIAHATV